MRIISNYENLISGVDDMLFRACPTVKIPYATKIADKYVMERFGIIKCAI